MDGPWIQTYTGRKFYPLSPRAADICILDICHALSMKCRYTGHCEPFYSVAQHSVLAYENCPEAPLWALLHDATEAYMPDVAAPIKPYLPEFIRMEAEILNTVADVFGLTLPIPDPVHSVDKRLMVAEKHQIMRDSQNWGVDNLEPLPVRIVAWAPGIARERMISAVRRSIKKKDFSRLFD